jgi:putative ABC transport system permease protein
VLAHYFTLARRSLLRTPIMTTLMLLAIGLGIGASMTMLTVLQVMSRDPLPGRSGILFYPHLDPLPKNYPSNREWGDPADNFTWPDAMALLHAKRATHQAAMAGGTLLVWPPQDGRLPVDLSGRYTTADFFGMFDVALERGSAWTSADDDAHARTIVLGHDLATRLFGSADPVGQTVRLTDKQIVFSVVGVAAPWSPQPLFYADASQKGNFGEQDDFFLPLSTSMELDFGISGNTSGWAPTSTDDMYTDPSTSWLQVWVQLDTPQQVAGYRRFLHDYAAQQHASGRFERGPETVQLYPLMDWLLHLRLVPDDVRLQSWLALAFLLVCLVNIVALLLAKFLRRSSEIGVRRALGARKIDIFLQLGVESALIGVLGGALGLVVAQIGLWSVRQRPDAYARVAQMDVRMLLLTVAIAIVAAVLAGLLPAWRASRVSPAIQIKAL